MKIRQASLLALAVVLGVWNASATTVLDDQFTEASRSGASNGTASIPWYYSGTTPAALAISSNQLTMAGSGLIVGYFTPQTLATGSSITLSFTFSAASITAVANGLRLGLFSSGGTQVSADGFNTANSAFSAYQGYGVFDDLGFSSATEAQLVHRITGSNTTLLGNNATNFIGPTSAGAGLTSGTSYTGTLTIANNGTNDTVTYDLGGTTLTFTDTTHYTSFDTIALQIVSPQAASISFSDISVTYSAVPEPGMIVLMVLGLGGLAWTVSRRPRRAATV